MYHRLKSFLDKNNILFKSQYGFSEKHSTQHAILDTVNIIQNNMDLKLFTCGILTPSIMLFCCQNLIIMASGATMNGWFSSYLLGRSEVTEVDTYLSSKSKISCGVPQGSVLGPLFFLIDNNDIHNSSDKLSFYLFADDTNLLYADNNLKSLEETVNNELLKVSEWLNVNKLTLNTKKSNYVIFRPYQRKLVYSVNIQMFDNSTHTITSLKCKEHVKYLGILLDSNLSWKFHIEYVALKISKILGVIARLRHFVPLCTLLNIYRSLIFPYMSYGLAAWV